MSAAAIILDEHKSLFKDEASYRQFVKLLRSTISQNTMPLILADRELLFTAVSPDATKEILSERILKRLWENPDLLDELTSRLESDEIVE